MGKVRIEIVENRYIGPKNDFSTFAQPRVKNRVNPLKRGIYKNKLFGGGYYIRKTKAAKTRLFQSTVASTMGVRKSGTGWWFEKPDTGVTLTMLIEQ